MKAFYTDHFVLPLPAGHRFPMEKYSRLRDLVSAQAGIELVEAPPATDTQILYAHDPGYLIKVIDGALSTQEQREIGFPWSTQMVERSRRSAGATVAAAKAALQEGISANLAGVHIMPIEIPEVDFVFLMTPLLRHAPFKKKLADHSKLP